MAGPQSRKWPLQLLGRSFTHHDRDETTGAGEVSNKPASKTLSKLAAGKVSVSFLAPDEPGRKASLVHLFPFCFLPTR